MLWCMFFEKKLLNVELIIFKQSSENKRTLDKFYVKNNNIIGSYISITLIMNNYR